jgi:hypothetical protein
VTCSTKADHRRHAIIEQVIADLKNGSVGAPAVRVICGQFGVAGAGRDGVQPDSRRRCPGRPVPRKAVTATIRTQLIAIAARVTRSARRATLRLPTRWPWATPWQQLFTAAIGPPPVT